LSREVTNDFSNITETINNRLIRYIVYIIVTIAIQGSTRDGRKEPRVAGLNGMYIGGRVSGTVKTPVLELSSITGEIVLSAKGSKELVWLESISLVLLSVLFEAACGAAPSPTITAKTNAPNSNSILDLKLNLLLLLLKHEFFISPPPL